MTRSLVSALLIVTAASIAQVVAAPPNIVLILADDRAEQKNLYAARPEQVERLSKELDHVITSGRSRP